MNWRRELVADAVFLLGGALAGAAFGYMWLGLWLVTLTYLCWHLVNLYRLERWLRRGRQFDIPHSLGIWGAVFREFYRLRRRERERKRAMARLLREFRDSTGAMPDGTVILERGGEIRWFNRAAARLLGLSPTQDTGQRIANLIRHPEFTRYLREGDYCEAVEIPGGTGREGYLALQIVPYAEAQRLLLVRDVTRLRRLERMRREFVANASHELRTPLTVVSGYLEALHEAGDIAAEWQAPLEEMRLQTRRMGAIVNDLLELSRLETERGVAPCQPVDMTTLLTRIRTEALALGCGPPDIGLDIDDTLCLLGEEHELHSAFSNLVFNAMRYTPDTGEVKIAWRLEAEGGAGIEVTDNGIGIAAEHLPHLTERFYRVDGSRQRDSGGTGLGLAIVKHVLQHHGARLEIQSTPGAGSRFLCHFPAQRVASATASASH